MSANNPNLPFRREPLYFYSEPPEELIAMVGGEERYYYLTGEILGHMFSNPSLSFLRNTFGELLWKMHNSDEPESEGGYSSLDKLVTISKLQEWLTLFGFVLGQEIKSVQEGEHIRDINPAPKYKTYPELLELAQIWKQEGKVVGLVHGAFDPPHNGHSSLFYKIWPYCDVLLIGFDSNSTIRHRKGEDRPRFPQLAWRMWEVASLPTVDNVFVLPVSPPVEGEKYSRIYEELGISILGTRVDNPFLGEYRRRMNKLGGHVLSYVIHNWSSTRQMNAIKSHRTQDWLLLSPEYLKPTIDNLEKKALSFGYLGDYPNGT
jgi:hypothetical protein